LKAEGELAPTGNKRVVSILGSVLDLLKSDLEEADKS
jgi:hypothetical protein